MKEKLLTEHKAAWKTLWDTGRIDIEGDLEMAQAVYGSMYYILSSTRHDWPYGLSPGGLPGGEEYMGHTFWDQDIWMYPPLVLLHPDLARSSLKYRKDRLPAARRIAKEYGYKGKKVTFHVIVLTIHRIMFSTITTTVLIYNGWCKTEKKIKWNNCKRLQGKCLDIRRKKFDYKLEISIPW